MSNFIWPSDLDRAENDELDRVCEQLEAVMDERDDYKACAENWEANASQWSADWHELKAQLDAALEREAALAAHIESLNGYTRACSEELVRMIDKHNVQSDSDGSWLYDHQTPWELMNAVHTAPAASLARRDLLQRAEELEEVAAQIGLLKPNQMSPVGLSVELKRRAKTKRQQAKELTK